MSGFMIIVIFSNQHWGLKWLKYAICLVTKVVENKPGFYGNISHAIRFALLIEGVYVINCCLQYYHKRRPWKSAEICDSISCVTFSKSPPSLGLTLRETMVHSTVNCHVNWGGIQWRSVILRPLYQYSQTSLVWSNTGEGLSEWESPELQNRFEEWQLYYFRSVL